MRGLDDDNDTVLGDLDRGRSDAARAEHGQPEERVGNMRGLDDDTTDSAAPSDRTVDDTEARTDATDASADGDHTVDDDGTVRERGALERARERVDEVLGRRDADADADPERRQPE